MKARWLLITSVLTGTLLSASAADAACRENLLASEAQGRNAWAEKWGYLLPGEAAQLNSQYRYVEFTSGCYRLISGAACSPVIPVSQNGNFVGGLMTSDLCTADCFSPGQSVLVGV